MKKVAIYIIGVGMSLSILTACNNVSGKKEETIAKQMEVKRFNDSLKLDSFKRAEAAKTALAEEKKITNQSYPATKSSNVSHSNTATQSVSNSSTAATGQQKKGWSDAAKGGVIGGAAGAGIGALIDKKKPVRGAVIGAAVGGGSGYAIGRKSDRKSGRVQKK